MLLLFDYQEGEILVVISNVLFVWSVNDIVLVDFKLIYLCLPQGCQVYLFLISVQQLYYMYISISRCTQIKEQKYYLMIYCQSYKGIITCRVYMETQ